MRKKLGTRFPASRIKKIMQADEDVGKIALAVPILVSKALELFLQDLCDRTYEITLQRGAKTLNSLHLKQCVRTYSAYDFLTGVVNKVPNLGGMEPCEDDKGICRRRKTLPHGDEVESNENCQLRSSKMPEGMKEDSHQSALPSSTPVMNGSATSAVETKQEQCSAWPLPGGVDNISIEPSRLVQLTMQIDEDEDYDNED
ncbi:hypothetical protein C4D60_Mb09t20770 [Musa balbisiana]|uniref:Transcription factor CBF/NF-Y/archaeal histone domain-containing protein n=1 Tax=Musa balbisiana TaxID=52838 RepID=A0A4S8IHZ1_MUSBA|nr:hypothetical protein C4D60_Mb09t20770 [Musa balbisiana]